MQEPLMKFYSGAETSVDILYSRHSFNRDPTDKCCYVKISSETEFIQLRVISSPHSWLALSGFMIILWDCVASLGGNIEFWLRQLVDLFFISCKYPSVEIWQVSGYFCWVLDGKNEHGVVVGALV